MVVNVNRFIKATKAEGPGLRSCVWFQGCRRHCEGCFATDTWPTSPNKMMAVEDILRQSQEDPLTEGITVLGGEPFEQPEALAELLQGAWQRKLSTIVFTGNTYEQLQASDNQCIENALHHIDVLIDGPFVQTRQSFKRPMIGSDNQRFIFLTTRYSMSDFRPNSIEVRIGADGMVMMNGMGKMQQIKDLFYANNQIDNNKKE